MSLQNRCPLCGSDNLEQNKVYEQYFVFKSNANFVCKNCGCCFIESQRNQIQPGTKISKKEFFSEIFMAVKDIFHLKNLTKEQRMGIEELYSDKIKEYYKEILDAHINLFYESACSINEKEFFKKLEEDRKK